LEGGEEFNTTKYFYTYSCLGETEVKGQCSYQAPTTRDFSKQWFSKMRELKCCSIILSR